MALFRWLFHPLLWLLVVLGAVAWLYRDSWLPEQVFSPEIQVIGERIGKLFGTAEGEPAQSHEPDSDSEYTEIVVPAQSHDAGSDSGHVEIVVSTLNEVVRQPSSPAWQDYSGVTAPATDEDTVTVLTNDESASYSQSLDSEPEVSSALQTEKVRTDDGKTIPESKKQAPVDPRFLWHQARAQAWMGDWQGSLASYQQLLLLEPSNFDAYGEMGNVYLRVGNVDGAVKVYSEAALLISRAGYPHVAWNVLGIVSRLDYQQGEALYQSLREQQLPSTMTQ